jgi:alkylated DNA repair protein alkB family protein 8
VADGLALPYRPGSCDGALCIAVLHHLASPARRLALLAQLLRILRPGGRALVTVWATQQENMKKVRSWQPVDAAAGGAAAAAAGAAGKEGGASGAVVEAAGAADGEGQQQVSSGDYFVPWHLPFHRAEAAAAARQVEGQRQEEQQAGQQQEQQQDASQLPPSTGSSSAPQIDSRKGAVVFQRYYHLFEAGELDGLVGQLAGAAVVDSFYDKDNWCCVFERTAQRTLV